MRRLHTAYDASWLIILLISWLLPYNLLGPLSPLRLHMALQTDFAIITHPLLIHISHFTNRSLRLEYHGHLRWLLGEMTD